MVPTAYMCLPMGVRDVGIGVMMEGTSEMGVVARETPKAAKHVGVGTL